jgi:hypothetical protein
MAFPPVYNVPNAPGIPPMVRSALTAVSTTQGIVAGVQNTIQFFQGRPALPQWGIFDDKLQSVIDADSFLSFSDSKQSNIADFPVQNGGFASYNKVITPGRNAVRISKGGTQADRAALLRQIKALFATLGKYTIVTPEASYLNVNLESYEVTRRDSSQAFFLTEIDLFFREIQETQAVFTNTPAADTTNAQAASAQPPVNQGVVQPQTPSSAAQNEATSVLAGNAP